MKVSLFALEISVRKVFFNWLRKQQEKTTEHWILALETIELPDTQVQNSVPLGIICIWF